MRCADWAWGSAGLALEPSISAWAAQRAWIYSRCALWRGCGIAGQLGEVSAGAGWLYSLPYKKKANVAGQQPLRLVHSYRGRRISRHPRSGGNYRGSKSATYSAC
jgi:hypothetical protein